MTMLRIVKGLALTASLAAAGLFLARPAAAADSIRIAVAGPITGSYAQFGAQLSKGAKLAVQHVNARGGILGKSVELVPGDDACDPKQARAVANYLANQGVAAVIGHFCSSSTLPASEVYAEEGVLQITPASTNPAVTERGIATLFRVCGRDDQQGGSAARYIAERSEASRVAVIHDKTTYGQGLADETRKALAARGKTEVLYEGISIGDKDFSALVSKMKAQGVDFIYFGGLHAEAALLLRQARDQGLAAPFMSGDGIVDKAFADIAGPAADGVLMTFQSDPRKLPGAQALVAEFRDQEQYDPEGYTLLSYAALQVLAAAMDGAGSTDAGKVSAFMKAHPFETVLGTLHFDAKGDLSASPYVIYRWQGGTYAELPE
ncbi:MAG: branched-chain amino acid ABC transporter substrate-binding protein [Thermodesulfobacteriota bacterium]